MPTFDFRDAEIRAALKDRLKLADFVDHDTVIFDELGVCRGEVRVDVALVNGAIHGYEIKSDRDTLRRLPRQIELYGKVLDRVTLVVGARHLPAARSMLPKWWGILLVENVARGLNFRAIRRTQDNPGRERRVLAELLWRDHAVSLLERHGLARGVKSKPCRMVWDRIGEALDIEVIAAEVRSNLKSRAKLLVR